ncbi:hypothetical protein PYCCODRAFT_1470992 [Trametes coccinea BRFM310]|uniref:DUF6534 domain-containing protein n=1 Tax=Trametes coccinea (strain BRFM310) TaxID=1353009 RepID=A0A1Y2IBK2_TRAC3|nr:hypothetical protein PYCCODRAFT_1470992 [Trametes coccinea BRFM310]
MDGSDTQPHLDDTFGALLVGTFFGTMLYGLMFHQSYRYFRRYPGDLRVTKSFVAILLALETMHTVAVTHACYMYLVTNYSRPQALTHGIWSMDLLPLLTGSSSSYLNASTVKAYVVSTFDEFNHFIWLDSAGCAVTVASDVLTTSVLITVLKQSRTGVKQTDYLLDRLVKYSINTGLLIGLFDTVSFVLSFFKGDSLIFTGIAIAGTKLYANSVLAVLNSRRSSTGATRGSGTSGTYPEVISLNNVHVAGPTFQAHTVTVPSRLWRAPTCGSEMCLVPCSFVRYRGWQDAHGSRTAIESKGAAAEAAV